MIICFEGMSCAGKTSIIKEINKIIDSYIVEEIYVNDISNSYIKNDVIKNELIIKNQFGYKFILIDRFYLSTLCYEYLFNLNKYNHLLLNYLNKKLCNEFITPDLYVYMTLSNEETLKRLSCRNNKSYFKGFKKVNNFYKSCFNILETGVPVLNIDGNDKMDINVNTILNYIGKGKTLKQS